MALVVFFFNCVSKISDIRLEEEAREMPMNITASLMIIDMQQGMSLATSWRAK